MFIDQLTNLCKRDNIKLSVLMKELGLSTGNIKRWKEGATVKSEILLKVAKYFNVSCDYLLTGKNAEMPQSANINLREDEERLLQMYNLLDDIKKGEILGRLETITEQIDTSKQQEKVG